jgi:hypothetical protein
MARQLSMATRRELKDAIRERYQGAAGRQERRQILSEFVRVTGVSSQERAVRVESFTNITKSAPARATLR